MIHVLKSPVVLMAVHILPVPFSALYSHVYRKHQSSGAIQSRQQSIPVVEQGRISPVFQPPESMLSDSDTDLQSLYDKCNYVGGNEEVEVHTCFLHYSAR